MNESQFSFLRAEFAAEFDLASRAEEYALSDPGSAAIYARRCLETGVAWVYRHDRGLPQPHVDRLDAYLNEPAFKALVDGRVFEVARKIQRAGNRAVRESKAPSRLEAVEVVSALFQFCFWLAFTYGRAAKPDPSLKFDPRRLTDVGEGVQSSLQERQELEERLALQAGEDAPRGLRAEMAEMKAELEAELGELRRQVAAAKKTAESLPFEAHDWSEADTRRYKIDALLAESGWTDFVEGRDIEYEVHGMPSGSGVGYVDYVLWGEDGLPLAVVEAKKALKSPHVGQQQARLYADCLEGETGQRPVVFYSNGYEHWLWDDTRYPARPVQGFYTSDELALLIQRRTTCQPLPSLPVTRQIVERHYQLRAISAIAEHFDTDKQRKALLVMATGAGKTRTVIALVDLLMRAGWVKRVLFLADRTALVNQAVNAFKAHLPDSAPVNLVTEGDEEGRVYVSTYQTMVGKIDEYRPDGTRRFGVGYFDLVVIDEAHRSVYRKYRGIFDYFDSLLVGLTATPKDEVDKNTYDLFDLETGVPTDAYSLDEAIKDGYLVPPRGVSVPLKFVREGIRYDELPEDEKDAWDELDWGENEEGSPIEPPDAVDAAQLNKWLFNEDTVDRVLQQLMTEGIKVAGGDRLGKTIIFAKNQRHADYIKQRFDANYPALDAGNFARVITHQVQYVQSLIDAFSNKDKAPHIVVSVDMLDTGIDIPEVVNLVFFKLVRSKTKFWQMLGRGTRLCEDLFGPGDNKAAFSVFDFCQNLEYFSEPIETAEPSGGPPLSEIIFSTRLDLLHALDGIESLGDERAEIAATLRQTVASMNPDNFLVRPHLELVERFGTPEAWEDITLKDLAALNERVAKLPDQLDPDDEDAKRFDVVMLNGQLRLLRHQPFERQRKRVIHLASALEDLGTSIPVIAAQMELILDIQTDEWWVDGSYSMLEDARKRLRSLVQLIERIHKTPLYSDFTDSLGDGTEIEIPGTGGTVGSSDFAQFRNKAQHFLARNFADQIVAKVRSGEPLAAADMDELQRVLVAAGIGDTDTFAQASERAGSFGLFVRSLVGLDRAAAKQVFNRFLDDKRYSRNQITFVNLVIDYLTEHGTIDPGRIYDSPFTSVAPEGPETIFIEADLDDFFKIVRQLHDAALV